MAFLGEIRSYARPDGGMDLFGFQKIKLICFPIEQTGYVLKVMKLQSLLKNKTKT